MSKRLTYSEKYYFVHVIISKNMSDIPYHNAAIIDSLYNRFNLRETECMYLVQQMSKKINNRHTVFLGYGRDALLKLIANASMHFD